MSFAGRYAFRWSLCLLLVATPFAGRYAFRWSFCLSLVGMLFAGCFALCFRRLNRPRNLQRLVGLPFFPAAQNVIRPYLASPHVRTCLRRVTL